MSERPNQMSRLLSKFDALPGSLRVRVVSFLLGRLVPMVGAAGLRFEDVSGQQVVVSIRNVRKVQNHIRGVHAAGMALLAETATGFCVGMNLPDDKLPLIKTLKVDYNRRAVGGLRAVARLTPEQIALFHTQDKGEVLVPVTLTDESGQEPIAAHMLWAWVPKHRK